MYTCQRKNFIMPFPFQWSVSAATVTLDSHNRVLLQRRRDTGEWQLPGGVVNLGESPWEAAERETLEETGVTVEVGSIVGVYTVLNIPVQEFLFSARAVEGEPHATDESTEAGFFDKKIALDMVNDVFARKIEQGYVESEIDRGKHDSKIWIDTPETIEL